MPQRTPDVDSVTALLVETAQTFIMPRFRQLAGDEIERKSTAADPDDVVTAVDHAVEQHLTRLLGGLPPGAPVVGEEAVHREPQRLRTLDFDEPLWLLDPIDGTKNFVAGQDAFGIMLSWVVGGHAQAAWVVLPARGQIFVAEAGSGAFSNGVRVTLPVTRAHGLARGALSVRYMPQAVGRIVAEATSGRFLEVPLSGCAAVDYTDILRGVRDFAVFYRLLPWDHATPSLILREAGGRVEHLDGSGYSARSGDRITVAASHVSVSEDVRAWLRRPMASAASDALASPIA